MKILVIGSLAESLINFRGHLLKAFLDKGLEVHVAAPGLTVASDCTRLLASHGYLTHDIPLRRAGMNPFADLLSVLAMFTLMRRIRPDMILTYTVKPVIYGTLAAWISGVPQRFALITGLGYAFTGEVAGVRRWIRQLLRGLYRAALAKEKKVFFQNPDDRALFCNIGLLKLRTSSIVLNGSGVDVATYSLAPIPPGAPHFLMIARLLGDKGTREYVRAAQHIKAENPDIRFSLVGWIDENPDAIAQSELDEWVRSGTVDFLGFLKDVRPAIAGCSVYVLPSYREGTPRTVLEAMSMGRPIITTDAPGCRETVVDGYNGFLVPIQSVNALVYAMKRFVNEPILAKEMGLRSRDIARKKYDVHMVNALILKEMGL